MDRICAKLLENHLGISNLCMKAFFDRDVAGDDDDERSMRRTRSMRQKMTTGYNHTDIPPMPPLIFHSLENTGVGTCNDNFHGLRTRLTGRRFINKTEPSDPASNCRSGPPKAVTKDQEECSRYSVPSCRNKPKQLSQDPVHQKTGGIGYRFKRSKALNSQIKSETNGISNGRSIHHIKYTRFAQRKDKLAMIWGREKSVLMKSLPIG